jgi:hypothetical protein
MRQTAVEWLVEQFQEWNSPRKWTQIINQAKEMEKEDICNFGAKCCFMTTQKKSWTIEELYNETFKNKENESRIKS